MGKAGGTKVRRNPRRRAKSHDGDAHSVTAEITMLLNTLRELAAIRSTAEDGAARFLDSAEGLLALADKEEAKKAEDAILSIMTACGFHDLVSQRVTKITQTLDSVIASRLNDEAPANPPSEITLEGPGLPAADDQARIDKLFSENN